MEQKKGFWNPVTVLVSTYTVTLGFSALDRLLIAMLFPFVLPEFGLDFTQAGILMTCMAVGYFVFAFIGGVLSDKYGRKKVILPSVLIFSLGSALTGLATGFASLVGVRTFVGRFIRLL
ncbi:Sialic acid transporter NanT [Sporomusa silvacetica DSM 10669]|uniref:Sialic acid transporter NanT n=1 Tax=Sporomusa silvacetica DSM 10669 TaxID=1123289 RepID=A0ABZ3ITC1_9FIRM|nr:MFS transporter [Sporomusa silvacetica]OZC22299.1 hexuronate transporter [Sporomusa silvacetica DSM 10669]